MIWRIIKLDGENLLEKILGALFYILPIGLIFSLVINLGGVSDFTKKISPINSIVCSSLKNEIASTDEIGRDLWNAYQSEVSSLADTSGYLRYRSKIENVARRAKQLLTNDNAAFMLLDKKRYCIKDEVSLEVAMYDTANHIDDVDRILSGNYINWDRNFYAVYYPNSQFLK